MKPETVIRSSGRMNQAEEWALVLASAGIPHRVEALGEGWTLSVPDAEVARACAALEAFDADEAARVRIGAPADRPVPWVLGIAAGAFLLAGFAVTGPPVVGSRWFERGAVIAGSMGAEPWRAVTALTLHLDVAHVAGNAVATAVLLPAIAQRLGAGVGLFLVLLGGTAGNVLAALAHVPGHAAVGASTATFAAIGTLAALRLRPGSAEARWKVWTVPAAGLVLLAMLGAGRGADVLAHVTGFLSGAALGLVVAVVRPPPGRVVQWTLGVLSIAIIAVCWLGASRDDSGRAERGVREGYRGAESAPVCSGWRASVLGPWAQT
jgi:membrane associated rhomboid family serine protease